MQNVDYHLKFYRKFFYSKRFLSYMTWIHSGCFAASFAFFLALFSVGKPENFSSFLDVSGFMFAISLVANMIATLVCICGQRIPRVTAKLVKSGLFLMLPLLGVTSMTVGVLTMICHFSVSYAVLPSVLIILSVKGLLKSISVLSLNQNEFDEVYSRQE
ncbi:conserved membrane hypothetical protein [Vibrio crassostreae]|uniref:Uncharacterized protein n=2 Tax=Vibrionaceae TaxID=641 RepID=A0ABM9QVZ4_9VIBR|nr:MULTISPECIES: hypothetical protein [Vibrio]TCL15551.1 hypothetical protein EDB52_1318 [Vibrio crassostreae]TCT41916.1 hypothetical protein EDB39_1387 [Vibrio crassostreae]TCT47352.1 hypothetical protein EDB40_1368 [Vibrio crassostreae]CAK2088613.1 conserved membrane hypothetical protein [Vibrio crassostreae]CAK2094446.1 conserved membrane hypothetical protein [Vibrio crassostreae]